MALTTEQQQQLVDVYKRAEAAGDTAAMEQVRAALAEGEQAPKQDSMDAFNKDPLGEMFKANADQNTEQREAMASGVGEGLKRVAGGVKQFAGGAVDAFNMFVKGKPYFNPYTKKYEASSSFNQATINEAARQKVSELEATEAGINPGLRNAVASTTENLALTGATEVAAAPRAATTLTGAMIRNAVAGGAQAAVQFDTENKGIDVLLGAGGSTAFSALTGMTAAVNNMVARGILSRTMGSRTEKAVEGAQKVLPNFKPTLAQRTGIPEIKTLEQAGYNSELVKHYADQNDKFVQDISTVLNQPIKPGQDLATDFVVAKNVAQAKLDAMKANRISLWENGMNDVRAAVPKTGPKNVPAQNLINEYGKVKDDAENILRNMGSTKLNAKAMRALDQLLLPPARGAIPGPAVKGIAVDDFADLLQGLTKIQRESTDPAVKAVATRMRKAMDADISNLASYNGPALPAVSKLLQVRTEYQRAALTEKLMKDSVTYKLLGVGQKDGKAAIPDSSELVENFSKFAPEKQREFRSWAEANSPEVLSTMKDKVIKDALQKSKTITEARDSQVSLEQLTDTLFDPKRGFDLRTTGLWSPSEQQKFEGIRDGLRVIANQRTANRGAGTAIKAEDLAINIISRSGPFLARQAARVFYGTKAAGFLADPRAYEYLTTIRKTSGSTQLAARMALMELLQTEYDAAPTEDSGTAQPAP